MKMSNKKVEEKAVEFVREYERKHGNKPISFGNKKNIYDIESDGKLIEVKGRRRHFSTIELQDTIKRLTKNKDYYIYLVYNIHKIPKLKIIPQKIIHKNIEPITKYKLRQSAFSNIIDEKDFP